MKTIMGDTEEGGRRLAFDHRNAKAGIGVHTLSLPSGYTCTGALHCLAFADRFTGKIKDGPNATFRCYSASQEIAPNVRESRWRNYELLRKEGTAEGMAKLIERDLPSEAATVRPNASGDFFDQNYFDAWLLLAERRSDLLIYTYTKSIPFWVARLDRIPVNFVLTASLDGKYDDLVYEQGLRYAKVVFIPEEAARLGLRSPASASR